MKGEDWIGVPIVEWPETDECPVYGGKHPDLEMRRLEAERHE